jgi:glycosyltransferase involved in cell wall biosynthesis
VGGIATWTRVLLQQIAAHASASSRPGAGVEIVHVDTAVRWRPVTWISPVVRMVGGTVQALRDFGRYRRLLASAKPDVVHVCTSAGMALPRDLTMMKAARRRGVPAIIHFRMGRIPELARTRSSEWVRLVRVSCEARLALVLDRRSVQVLDEACPGVDVRSMPNMVDLRALDAVFGASAGSGTGSGTEGLRIAYVGHVLASKGVGDLAEACAQSGVKIALDIVGPVNEDYRQTLEARLAGSATAIRFQGTLSHEDALRTMRRADVLALPSRSEGFPNVVAEAMACGRPVLATSVGAMPEMLDVDGPEPCGICVEPGDTEALARAIGALADDPDRRLRLGARGRTRVETLYAAPIVTARLVKLWNELASG